MANTRYLYLIEELEKAGMPSGCTVVDCGCGEGIGSAYLKEHGYNTLSFDVSEAVFPLCRELGVEPEYGDITNLKDVMSNSSHAFICSETLEHLSKKDSIKASFEIKRVCKKGGLICITVPEDKKLCLANKKHKQYLSYDNLVDMFSLSVVFKGKYCKNERKCNLVVIFKNE
jgi:ubiquinone/menaquinone biosynthesis C-methylase UbiE